MEKPDDEKQECREQDEKDKDWRRGILPPTDVGPPGGASLVLEPDHPALDIVIHRKSVEERELPNCCKEEYGNVHDNLRELHFSHPIISSQVRVYNRLEHY